MTLEKKQLAINSTTLLFYIIIQSFHIIIHYIGKSISNFFFLSRTIYYDITQHRMLQLIIIRAMLLAHCRFQSHYITISLCAWQNLLFLFISFVVLQLFIIVAKRISSLDINIRNSNSGISSSIYLGLLLMGLDNPFR